MSVKRLSVALAALLALAAVFANSAFATATTTNSYWYEEGSKLLAPESVRCQGATSKPEVLTPFILTGTVAGAELEIEAKKLECALLISQIKKNGEHAEGTGQVKFSELTVKKPVGCKVPASNTTNSLTARIYMEGTAVYVRFTPTEGETLASVSLTECAAEGKYSVKGTLFGKSPNATGKEVELQNLAFSSAIQKEAGGAITLGANAAQASGSINYELTFKGPWGAKET